MSRNSALTARARRYLADAAHAFDHAPVEVSLAVLLAIAFSYTVSSDAEPFREWVELAVVILLTGAAAFTATLMHALGAWSTRTRWLVTAAGVGIAALYGVLVIDFRFAAEAWRAAALVTAAALLIVAVPALASGEPVNGSASAQRFRQVTGRLLMRALAVLLYAAVLYAGLALALGAINTLFELRLDARVFAHTLGWIFFVLVPWVIAGGLPDYVRPDDAPGPVGAAVHRISAFLVTPLLAIYYLILYAYSVRIAVTGELPKNLVSPLVIAAGLIAGIALVLFDRSTVPDEPATDESRGTFRPLRLAAPLFLPLCTLGVWAVSMRLDQYGWTEFRALRVILLVALGALALAAAIRLRQRGTLPVHLLPLSLAVVLVLSVVGPWSVMSVSRRSQQGRLASAMGEAGIAWDATTIADTIIPNEPFNEISETARYLNSHFGPDALPPLLARHADGTGGRYVDVVYEAGLRSARPDFAGTHGAHGQLESGAALGDGAFYYVRLDMPALRPGAGPAPVASDTSGAAGPAEPLIVRVPVGGLTLIADLTPVAQALLADPTRMRGLRGADARVALRDERGTQRGELFVLEIGIGGGVPQSIYLLEGVARLVLP